MSSHQTSRGMNSINEQMDEMAEPCERRSLISVLLDSSEFAMSAGRYIFFLVMQMVKLPSMNGINKRNG